MYIKHGTSSQRHELGFYERYQVRITIGERLPARFAPNYPSVRYRRRKKMPRLEGEGRDEKVVARLQFSTNGGVLAAKRQHRPSKTNLYRPTHDR